MKYSNVIIAVIVILIMVLVYRVYYKDITTKKEHPATNEMAVKMDDLFAASDYYLREEYRMTSIDYLNKAIKAMRLIEIDMDSVSNSSIETAIMDLQKLESEIKNIKHARPLLRKSFVNALNSLAVAQLRISEKYLESGQLNKALYALTYADAHLKNAVLYSSDQSRLIEGHIYSLIDRMVDQDTMSPEQMITMLDSVITGLDTLTLKEP